MPAHVKKVNGKFYIVDPSGKRVKHSAIHDSKEHAIRQMTAINISEGFVPGMKKRMAKYKMKSMM